MRLIKRERDAEGEMEAAKLGLRKKKKIQRNKVRRGKKGKEKSEPMLMCESAAQQETGLIITLGLLCSPTHSITSL